MKTLNKTQKLISITSILLMFFSPFVSVLAEEGTATIDPTTTSSETVTDPQPARGVDATNLGPQATATIPVVDTTPIVDPVLPTENPVDSTQVPTATTDPSTGTTENVVTSDQPSVENTNTGTNSQNSASNEQNNQTDAAVGNEASVINDIRGVIGTPGNVVTETRGNVDIITGDAAAALSMINLINTVFAGLFGENVQFVYKDVNGDFNQDYVIDPLTGRVTDKNGNPVIINDGTGTNSLNDATNDSSTSKSLTNSNLSDLINRVNLGVNTGDNRINNQVGDNLIDTGNADISLNLLNFLNSTFVVGEFGVIGILNIMGDWSGNLLLPTSLFAGASSPNVTVSNNNTGTNSQNTASSNLSNSDSFTANNDGTILNKIGLTGNTGGNVIDSNVGDSNIITGSVNLLLNNNNFLNLSIVGDVIYMAFVNVLGEWNGQDLISKIFGFNPTVTSNATSNNNTGTNSQNSATNDQNNTTDIDLNNKGSITNLINLFANTGNNAISSERGDSTIQTGNINVLSNLLNFINTNIYGKRVVLLFVNVFGNWTGNIDFLKQAEPKQVVVLENTESNQAIALTSANSIINSKKVSKTNNNSSGSEVNETQESVVNDQGEDIKVIPPSSDHLAYELGISSDKTPVEYVASNINIIIFALIVIYLASVALYLKATKKMRF